MEWNTFMSIDHWGKKINIELKLMKMELKYHSED